jgi:hypothetical protein
MQDRLREQWRARMGRASTPSAVVIYAQSTRASPQGGESGFDAGKKVKGRKRNLVVDTMGLLIAVTVTAASVQDRMLPQPWLRKRAPKALGSKSCKPTARTVGSARMTSSRRIIFVSKSFVVRVTAQSERCIIPRRHLSQLRLSMQASWFCPCAGSSNELTRGLNAGAGQ